jgi:hypothetical protein
VIVAAIEKRDQSTCQTCGRPIAFIVSANTGKPIPVEIEPRRSIVTAKGETYVGWESHFAHCGQADAWRGQSRGGR